MAAPRGEDEEGPLTDETREATILVVDAVEANRRVLATWLAEAGFAVEEAATGADALVRAGGAIDLVLVDVDLPDLSGLEVCRALKAMPAPAPPVIELSATHVDSAHRTAGLRSGAEGYLVEPVSRDELLASVEAVLRDSQARRRAERLAARLERLNVATLEMSRAEGLAPLVVACAEQSAAVLEGRAIVVAAADGQAVLARADATGLTQLDQMLGTPAALDTARLPVADEPYSVLALDRETLPVASDLGPSYRAVAVHSRQGGARAIIGVELEAGGAALAEADLVLRQVARALGVALGNLHVLRVERSLALQLQHSLLPTTLPTIDGLELAVRYVASAEHAEIGGDFFEILELEGDRVGIAIGDVQGHSLDAAAVMAGLRHWVQAYALEGHRPAAVLQRVNALLMRSHPHLIATACYGELDLASGRLLLANAGHVPPVMAGPEGLQFLSARGILLGVDGPPPPELEVRLEPGTTLVWVTDGLVERRSEPLEAGLDRLLRAIAAAPTAVPEPLERLCDRLLGLVGLGARDDVALIACRLTRPPAPADGRAPARLA